MIRIVFAVALGVSVGCTPLAPGAAQVVVTSDGATVQGCTPLGTVSGATAQIVGFDDPRKDMQNQALALGGDHLLLTSRFPFKGIAYRCAPPRR